MSSRGSLRASTESGGPLLSPEAGVVVASVPAGHPYVARLSAPGSTTTRRLHDPDPADPDRPARGPWWPAAMLEPRWVREHEFDLMHVHFGFDHRTPDELGALTGALRERRRPLVLTLHDLRSPHQEDSTLLEDQLDVLVPAAAALVTLTDTAADAAAARWDRTPEVVAHPHLVAHEVMSGVRAQRAGQPCGTPARIGVAAKSLRANTDVVRLLPGLAALASRGHRTTVSLHRSVLLDPSPAARATVAALLDAEDRRAIDLVVHEPLDDAALWSWIATLDVAVLPYRFGTHSGWLEMCHDLGTSVVAPSHGHYEAQGADAIYDADQTSIDTASLVDAVERALGRRALALPGRDAGQRLRQQLEIAAAHEDLYAEVLGRARDAS